MLSVQGNAITERSAESLIPLSNLSFHVLLALADKAAHGYAIGKEIEARSRGKLKPTTGALYQALHRLDASGLVASAGAPAGATCDPRRKYFCLTLLGHEVMNLEATRLAELVAAVRAKSRAPERS